MNESASNVNPSTDEIFLTPSQRERLLGKGYPWLPDAAKASSSTDGKI